MVLVQSTSSRVYHVIPDDHYPTNDNTYTLQHCLNYTWKYFTSNVQLHFLPGQYFLDTDLRISGISNFSLVGNISDGEVHTVINCSSPASVLVERKGIETRYIRTAKQKRTLSRRKCDENFGGDIIKVYNSFILLFKNTSFFWITGVRSVIDASNVKIYFEGSVLFENIQSTCCIINAYNSHLTVRNHTRVLNNTVYTLMNVTEIYLEEESVLNFTLNNATHLFSLSNDEPYVTIFKGNVFIETLVSPCLFQYVSNNGNLDSYSLQNSKKLKYSIIFNNNFAEQFSEVKYRTTHCSWSPSGAFLTAHPNYINKKIIHYYQNNFKLQDNKEICLCDNSNNAICQRDELDSIYPGQTITLQFIHPKQNFVGHFRIDDKPERACRGPNEPVVRHIDDIKCTTMEYTVLHKDGGQCEIYVVFQSSSFTYQLIEQHYVIHPDYLIDSRTSLSFDIFYIPLRRCPKGFSLSISGYCQCDPILSHVVLVHLTCDINDGTIPRPGNSWISGDTINNSHTYHMSLKCPFDYCIPHSSDINFTISDLQCQFSRCGVLCGECEPGLSTVFGSSQCKHCSNIYLLIIIPIFVAGLVLVFLLFFINLTVTDGYINGFLFYINVVSINTSTFFPAQNDSITFAHTFISLANLDLGIETCFYSGMDDYAKMWLQLTFPIYITFIATALIITSRYSTMIQRLTARRALPVLATLFLLSYTKILRTVCSVMFFYSTITHLPSGHSTLVWSVDANVPLFEVKFTILFTVCLLLFLILLPFNIVLLFTRTLSHLKFINHFKPLLDAFQGPYKDKFYYWTGLQLLLRAVFFGVSALDRSTNLMGSIILAGVMISIHGPPQVIQPQSYQLRNIVPDVAYKYDEFQEPLIGVD
ncbi:uncharacterized protein [Dysidea avara]|uniref:uncharacterized protein n=1 Tax=Dysidea avara TaxID=196820 RepID=UPI00331DA2D6